MLQFIAEGRLDDATTTLAAVRKKAREPELEKWCGDTGQLIETARKLPSQSRKIIAQLLDNALEKKRMDTVESLNVLTEDMNSLQRLITGIDEVIRPYSTQETVDARRGDARVMRNLGTQQMNVVDLIANGTLTEAREALVEVAASADEHDRRTLAFVETSAEAIARMENDFPDEPSEVKAAFAINLRAGKYEEALDLIRNHATDTSDIGEEAAQRWIEAASLLVNYCREFRHASLEARKLDVAKAILSGDIDKARASLTWLLDNFELSEPDEAWANSVNGLLPDLSAHPYVLRDIGDRATLRKLEEGEPLEGDAALARFFGMAATWKENYVTCAESLYAAVKPYVKDKTQVAMRESHKILVARHLAVEDFEEAALALTQVAASEDFDEASKNWIQQCSAFIGNRKSAPPGLEEVDRQLKELIRKGMPDDAALLLKKSIQNPALQASADNETAEWVQWATQSVYFVAVPLLLDRIYDELENDDLAGARRLLTSLVEFQRDEKRDAALSPDVQDILDQIESAGKVTDDWQKPVPVRPSAEPERGDDFSRGLFLNAEGTAIIKPEKDGEYTLILDRVRVDSRNRTITSEFGDYLGHYSSAQGNRLHADDQWLSRLPPVMNVARSDMLLQGLAEALHEGDDRRVRRQNTYEENMKMYQRIKEQARLTRKEGGRFNPKRIGKSLWRELDFGEMLDAGIGLFAADARRFKTTPGQMLSKYGKVTKNALTVRSTGIREEYENRLAMLRSEARYELQKLHPKNRKLCTDIQEKIENKLRMVSDEVKPDDQALQEIDGMFNYHQLFLSINHNFPVPLEIDHELKAVALDSIPFTSSEEVPGSTRREIVLPDDANSDSDSDREAGRSVKSTSAKRVTAGGRGETQPLAMRNLARDEARLALDQFEQAHSQTSTSETNKKVFLFHGTGGTGKSFDSRRAGFKIYSNGRYTKEVPPLHYSIDGLVKLAGDSRPRTENEPQRYYSPYRQVSPWMNPPEKQLGALMAYIIIEGYEIFLFEEGEKLILPEGRKSEEVANIVKYLLDPDTRELEFEIDGLKGVVPLDRQLFIFNSNKNFNRMGLPPEELRVLMRRFDVRIVYEESSPVALKSAFDKKFHDTLALESDKAKASAIRAYFKDREIDEQIIRTGKDIDPTLPTPDTVGRVTSVITNSLLADLKDVDAKKVREKIDIDALCRLIEDHWQRTVEKYAVQPVETDSPPARTRVSMAARRPAMRNASATRAKTAALIDTQTQTQAPPPVQNFPPRTRGRFYRDVGRITVPVMVCNQTMRDCNKKLAPETVTAMDSLFLEQNCINEITKRFTKTYSRDSVFMRVDLSDRDILKKAVESAHAFFLKNYQNEDFVPEKVFTEILTVFRDARTLMSNNSLQREICVSALKDCNARLDDRDIAADVLKFFREQQCISVIMRYFANYRFSTEETLRGAVEAAYEAFVEHHGREDFTHAAVFDAIEQFFAARKERNERVPTDVDPIEGHPFSGELSSSAMSDSDDSDARKDYKQSRKRGSDAASRAAAT